MAARIKSRQPPSASLRLALVGVVVVIGSAGCVGSEASLTAQVTKIPSVQTMLSATPGPTQALTPAPTPTAQPTLTFVATGSMHTARIDATATLLKNGKVLIAGGSSTLGAPGNVDYASAELYDPATGKFTKTGSMTVARVDHTATLLQDGRVLIAGGADCTDPACVASAELYDPTAGKFTRTGSMSALRSAPSATLLPDGRVLLNGGGDNPWAELYDPKLGQFVRTGKELLAGYNDTAVPLPSGNVMLVGGPIDPPLYGALYDEAGGQFTKISCQPAPGTMPTVEYKGQVVKRVDQAGPAAVLKDGRVMLFESGYLETYDLTTGACAGAGFISTAGLWLIPTATTLTDGRVLFAGGQLTMDPATYDDQITNTAVLYDPSSGSQIVGSMKSARRGQTSTLLPNGSVLIAGGAGDDGTSAELLTP